MLTMLGCSTAHRRRANRVFLPIHQLSYLNVILVISLPERTGQDKMEKTERFLEGTEISKDEIISTTDHIPKTESNHYQQGTLSSVRRCQALSPVLIGCLFFVLQDHTERRQEELEGRALGQPPEDTHEVSNWLP